MKPKVIIHNVEAQKIFEREMSDKEFKLYEEQRKIDELEIEKETKEFQAKESARISANDKLAKLGLTSEEISAITGA
jgi:hypothetical protein